MALFTAGQVVAASDLNLLAGEMRSVVVTTDATGSADVNFTITFPSNPTVVACIGDDSGVRQLILVASSLSTTKFRISVLTSTGAVPPTGSAVRINYYAAVSH